MDEDDLFCSKCGAKRKDDNKNLEITQSKSDRKTEEIPSEELHKKSSGDFISKAILVLVGIALIGLLASTVSFDTSTDTDEANDLDIQQSSNQNKPIAYELTQEEKNIQICEEVAKEYYNSHTYTTNNVFDCDNMAQDIWNMLKTEGINAKIVIGNTELGSSCTIEDINHAWVLAEVDPETWLAIECTGGYVVYDDNYYTGIMFSNPKNYRSFLDIYTDWEFQYQDYENYRHYFNNLVDEYNDANYLEQLAMRSGLEVARNTLQEKEMLFMKTDAELKALLEYG